MTINLLFVSKSEINNKIGAFLVFGLRLENKTTCDFQFWILQMIYRLGMILCPKLIRSRKPWDGTESSGKFQINRHFAWLSSLEDTENILNLYLIMKGSGNHHPLFTSTFSWFNCFCTWSDFPAHVRRRKDSSDGEQS